MSDTKKDKRRSVKMRRKKKVAIDKEKSLSSAKRLADEYGKEAKSRRSLTEPLDELSLEEQTSVTGDDGESTAELKADAAADDGSGGGEASGSEEAGDAAAKSESDAESNDVRVDAALSDDVQSAGEPTTEELPGADGEHTESSDASDDDGDSGEQSGTDAGAKNGHVDEPADAAPAAATTPAAAAAAEAHVDGSKALISGQLERKRHGLRTNWELRFFVISRNGVLHERSGPTETAKEKASYGLGLSRVSVVPDAKKPATFQIQAREVRTGAPVEILLRVANGKAGDEKPWIDACTSSGAVGALGSDDAGGKEGELARDGLQPAMSSGSSGRSIKKRVKSMLQSQSSSSSVAAGSQRPTVAEIDELLAESEAESDVSDLESAEQAIAALRKRNEALGALARKAVLADQAGSGSASNSGRELARHPSGSGGIASGSDSAGGSDSQADLYKNYLKIQEDYASLVKFKQLYEKEKEAHAELQRIHGGLSEAARSREARLAEQTERAERAEKRIAEAERMAEEASVAIEQAKGARARTALAERRLREAAQSSAALREEHARVADALRTEAATANQRTRQALAEAIELSRALDHRDRSVRRLRTELAEARREVEAQQAATAKHADEASELRAQLRALQESVGSKARKRPGKRGASAATSPRGRGKDSPSDSRSGSIKTSASPSGSRSGTAKKASKVKRRVRRSIERSGEDETTDAVSTSSTTVSPRGAASDKDAPLSAEAVVEAAIDATHAVVPIEPYDADALRKVLRQFLADEQAYIENLDAVQVMYADPLRESDRLDEQQYGQIFDILDDVDRVAREVEEHIKSLADECDDIVEFDAGAALVFHKEAIDSAYRAYVSVLPRNAALIHKVGDDVVPVYFLQHPLRRLLDYSKFFFALVQRSKHGSALAASAEHARVEFAPLLAHANTVHKTMAQQAIMHAMIDDAAEQKSEWASLRGSLCVHSGALQLQQRKKSGKTALKPCFVWLMTDSLVVSRSQESKKKSKGLQSYRIESVLRFENVSSIAPADEHGIVFEGRKKSMTTSLVAADASEAELWLMKATDAFTSFQQSVAQSKSTHSTKKPSQKDNAGDSGETKEDVDEESGDSESDVADDGDGTTEKPEKANDNASQSSRDDAESAQSSSISA